MLVGTSPNESGLRTMNRCLCEQRTAMMFDGAVPTKASWKKVLNGN